MIFKIRDLAELISRMDYPIEIALELLLRIYRKYGALEVIALFKRVTNIDLEYIGYNRYMIKYK